MRRKMRAKGGQARRGARKKKSARSRWLLDMVCARLAPVRCRQMAVWAKMISPTKRVKRRTTTTAAR
jgi:hypothetical protein